MTLFVNNRQVCSYHVYLTVFRIRHFDVFHRNHFPPRSFTEEYKARVDDEKAAPFIVNSLIVTHLNFLQYMGKKWQLRWRPRRNITFYYPCAAVIYYGKTLVMLNIFIDSRQFLFYQKNRRKLIFQRLFQFRPKTMKYNT